MAYLYDSDGDDFFEGTEDYGLLYGDDFSVKAWYFAVGQAIAEEHEDDDTADLYEGTIWEEIGDWETVNEY